MGGNTNTPFPSTTAHIILLLNEVFIVKCLSSRRNSCHFSLSFYPSLSLAIDGAFIERKHKDLVPFLVPFHRRDFFFWFVSRGLYGEATTRKINVCDFKRTCCQFHQLLHFGARLLL